MVTVILKLAEACGMFNAWCRIGHEVERILS